MLEPLADRPDVLPSPQCRESFPLTLLAAVGLLGGTVGLVWVALPNLPISRDPISDALALLKYYVIIGPGALGLFLLVYFLLPPNEDLRRRLNTHWNSAYTTGAVLLASGVLAAFIVHFGNQQFGGLDFSLLADIGWRLSGGQLPYVDFICTVPPGFYLGAKYASEIFGARWDSQLYGCAIFACITFLWTYCLLCRLLRTKLSAFLVAITIQSVTSLLLCFWWYNSITSIVGAIFFLSCILHLEQPTKPTNQISYVASLALLSLMKPNIAAPLICGSLPILFIVTKTRIRLLLLTLTGLFAAAGVLALNGISVQGMIESYRLAAVDRGRITLVGFRDLGYFDILRSILLTLALGTPMILWRRHLWAAFRRMNIREIAFQLLLLLAPVVSVLGMFTNMELKDVEWALLICFGSMVLFGKTYARAEFPTRRFLSRFYVALLCSIVAADVYSGAVRFRVETSGNHKFFDWYADRVIGTRYFPHLKSSGQFQTMLEQVRLVLEKEARPVFFGPRMEFSYAAFGIPSPKHLPLWWHPGSSFALAQEPAILDSWKAHRFETLIYYKNDFTYYSPQFMQVLKFMYSRDDSYSELTVFRLRKGATEALSIPPASEDTP